ncbi:hypothetical protein EVAR_54883_1 [Eumeta japonica]|uniref:Uncharacterized protein n=1 Tax=Eumeta variegata TaxID=151549 RepID=A0A4C2A0R7_EUMVA|nr:hypothetical protein EVAR_54883_1 [Eumeta japonica]
MGGVLHVRLHSLRCLATRHNYSTYNTQSSAVVKLVTKVSQRSKIGKRGRRRKVRGELHLRIASFTRNSERQSFERCTANDDIESDLDRRRID